MWVKIGQVSSQVFPIDYNRLALLPGRCDAVVNEQGMATPPWEGCAAPHPACAGLKGWIDVTLVSPVACGWNGLGKNWSGRCSKAI